MKKIIPLIIIVLLATACKKNLYPNEPNTVHTPDGFSSDRSRNLNIVYFVPSDLDTLPDYQSRLSDILLWLQRFYKDEMSRHGYPDKTFGMFVNSDSLVRIITIRGTKPKSAYPYEGGSGAVAQEVDAWFAAHPADNTSDHTLIIIPRYEFRPDGTATGGPFYGTGRWCYALDYEDFNIDNIGKANNQFTGWFGGLAHELGHGLNLPHNSEKLSEKPLFGTALMGYGNFTLGKEATLLTAADAAILSANQIFNKDSKNYYDAADAQIDRIHGYYDITKEAIVVSGKFHASSKINSIAYYNDPEGGGDYNAVTWESKPIGVDSFYVEMKISDLQYKADSLYDLRLRFVHDNGIISTFTYNYKFSNNLPVINFSTRAELNKQGWQIYTFSSEETASEDGASANLIDDNSSTYWHSRWSSNPASFPHEFVIDLGAAKTAQGLSYRHRDGLSRAVRHIEVAYSMDGLTFTSAGNFEVPNLNGPQYLDFIGPISFRFLKIKAMDAWDAEQFASIAEIGLY